MTDQTDQNDEEGARRDEGMRPSLNREVNVGYTVDNPTESDEEDDA